MVGVNESSVFFEYNELSQHIFLFEWVVQYAQCVIWEIMIMCIIHGLVRIEVLAHRVAH